MIKLYPISSLLKAFIGPIILVLLSTGFAFGQAGGIKGRVRNNSGSGIANASVSLTKGTDIVKTVKTSPDGNFEMGGITPGIYGLRVEADGYASGSKFGVEVKKDKVRDLGSNLFLNVDQGSLVILRGSVFFKEGTSVTGAKVKLERVNADGTTKELASVYSSSSGEFTFRQPPGGTKFRVTAKYKGVSGVKEIVVDNPAVYQVAISLDLSSADK